ncbi:hypothetical protein HELRODRAFT_161535 [Helobdella robusta]|uniref:Uncharacterized protein n=1 Tax=Helobdella robusta TaxID=6412 RepID=T1ERL5_HELRO|nr:hypothetical protein HELRODRAFT_161535 [Helobdella robusta]ESO02283.1 hypothetical protein HELRODRAFT_161535 [Helobdella robusta]
MASEIVSFHGSDTLRLRSNVARFKCDVWTCGKFFANQLYDFSPDKNRFGEPIKTSLKLSPNGLTLGDRILDKLKAIGAQYEHFDFERLFDIYQDRKYTNLVVCVLKSRLPSFKYEIYTYTVRKVNDAVSFEKLFRELVTGEKYFTGKSPEQIYGLNTLKLSEIKSTAVKPTGSINYSSSKVGRPISRSENNFAKTLTKRPTVVYTGTKTSQSQNNYQNGLNYRQTIRESNAFEIFPHNEISRTNSSTQTQTNGFTDSTISSIGSYTTKTFLNKNGLIMADATCYVESRTDSLDYTTKARAYVGKKSTSPARNYQNKVGSQVEKSFDSLASRQQQVPSRSYAASLRNSSNDRDVIYGRVKKKESQTQVMTISEGSSSNSSENITMRPSMYNYHTPHYNNNYNVSNRYNNQQPMTGVPGTYDNRRSKNVQPASYNVAGRTYYLQAPI